MFAVSPFLRWPSATSPARRRGDGNLRGQPCAPVPIPSRSEGLMSLGFRSILRMAKMPPIVPNHWSIPAAAFLFLSVVGVACATELHGAAGFGDSETLERLLLEGANPGATDEIGFTPLHHAAANGHAEAVVTLAAAGAGLNSTSPNGYTLLHLAASGGYQSITLNSGHSPLVSSCSIPAWPGWR